MAIDKDVLDQLLAGGDPGELFAKDGLLDELKALSERTCHYTPPGSAEPVIGIRQNERRSGSVQ